MRCIYPDTLEGTPGTPPDPRKNDRDAGANGMAPSRLKNIYPSLLKIIFALFVINKNAIPTVAINLKVVEVREATRRLCRCRALVLSKGRSGSSNGGIFNRRSRGGRSSHERGRGSSNRGSGLSERCRWCLGGRGRVGLRREESVLSLRRGQ